MRTVYCWVHVFIQRLSETDKSIVLLDYHVLIKLSTSKYCYNSLKERSTVTYIESEKKNHEKTHRQNHLLCVQVSREALILNSTQSLIAS